MTEKEDAERTLAIIDNLKSDNARLRAVNAELRAVIETYLGFDGCDACEGRWCDCLARAKERLRAALARAGEGDDFVNANNTRLDLCAKCGEWKHNCVCEDQKC